MLKCALVQNRVMALRQKVGGYWVVKAQEAELRAMLFVYEKGCELFLSFPSYRSCDRLILYIVGELTEPSNDKKHANCENALVFFPEWNLNISIQHSLNFSTYCICKVC